VWWQIQLEAKLCSRAVDPISSEVMLPLYVLSAWWRIQLEAKLCSGTVHSICEGSGFSIKRSYAPTVRSICMVENSA
jgi:hypothetical protein